MQKFECCYHSHCGGLCETEEEQIEKMCADCLREVKEAEHAHELSVAMKRIAVVAGLELASPSEVADVVCAKLHDAKELKDSVARWLAVSE